MTASVSRIDGMAFNDDWPYFLC